MNVRNPIGPSLLVWAFCYLVPSVTQCQVDKHLFTQIVDSAVSEGFSGVIIAAEKGKPFYNASFGFRDFEANVPMQKNDIFELASVSKQFTAMIIMMLQEQKKLSLRILHIRQLSTSSMPYGAAFGIHSPGQKGPARAVWTCGYLGQE